MSTVKNTPDEGQTFEERVNHIVEKFTTDESGKLTVPEDIEASEELLFAARTEKRRRDTQAAYTKTQQELSTMRRSHEEVLNRWEKAAVRQLPEEEQTRLATLKNEDPDKWREELNVLEQRQRDALKDEYGTIQQQAESKTEMERREEQLNNFLKDNPNVTINDEVIANDIPPRITKQLENSEITFEEFLGKCKKFLTSGKVLKVDDPTDEGATLDDVGGSHTPSPEDVEGAIKGTYDDEIY